MSPRHVTLSPTRSAAPAAGAGQSAIAWPPSARLLPARPAGDDLLAVAAAGPGDRVLVVGGERADLLCAALHRGCRSALGVALPQRHPEPADLVVAPRVASAAEAAPLAECARRALRAGGGPGRLAIGLAWPDPEMLGRSLARALGSCGFTRARRHARAGGGLVLICELSPGPVLVPVGPRRGTEH